MPFALLLALVAAASGTLLTYLYDRKGVFLERLCAGAATGWAALALVGFVFASWMGLTPLALVLTGLVLAVPSALVLRGRVSLARVREDAAENWRAVRRAALRPAEGRAGRGTVVFFIVAALVFWFVFSRVMYGHAGGVFTGAPNNIGDLPLHLGIISGFVDGDNFPPQHPEFAGARLTYPFAVDFLAAVFVRAGASLEGSLFWQGYVLMLSLTGMLYRWARALTRDHLAAVITTTLALLGSGFGWVLFVKEAFESRNSGGFINLLWNLKHDYSINALADDSLRWPDAITALLVTQRGFLLGIPLALLVWTLWWQAGEEEEKGKGEKGKRGRGDDEGDGKPARVTRKGKKKKSAARETETARRAQATTTTATGRKDKEADADSSTLPPSPPSPFPLFPFSPFSPLTVMAAAGVAAGMLPLVHAHTFAVVLGVGGCVALLDLARAWRQTPSVEGTAGGGAAAWRRLAHVWQPWAAFFVVALVLSVPQLVWVTRERGIEAKNFIGFAVGWDRGEQNPFLFWLKNTAFFIPLLVLALVGRVRGRRLVPTRLFYFYLPFTLCFIVPNLVRLSPWIWDNIKILYWWYVASAVLVALVLAWLWRRGRAWRAAALLMLLATTLAGALDVWRVASGAFEYKLYGADEVGFAELLKRETPPRSLILHAPAYNDPVYLTGRRSFLGYTGHLGSHGFDYNPRLVDLKKIYAGSADADALLARHGIEYVVVGPLERSELKEYGTTVNEAFFTRYPMVGETAGGFRLYKTARP